MRNLSPCLFKQCPWYKQSQTKSHSPPNGTSYILFSFPSSIRKGQSYSFSLPSSSNVHHVKERLFEWSRVPCDRQKLLGFVKGQLPDDSVLLRSLHIPSGHSFMLMGTADCDLLPDRSHIQLDREVG